MAIEIDAVYENGSLKLEKPLPFQNGKKVRLRIWRTDCFQETAGLCGFTGTAEEADYLASDPDLDYPPPPEEP